MTDLLAEVIRQAHLATRSGDFPDLTDALTAWENSIGGPSGIGARRGRGSELVTAPFRIWPDCCRRTGGWSRKAPRLFACATCGEVMHTKIEVGALHHQRLHPGSDIYVTHTFRHFDATDESEFGMYTGDELRSRREDPYWPHFRVREQLPKAG